MATSRDLAKPTSFRLPTDIVEGLRKRADERGETMSDLLREGALLILGYCPTCQRKMEPGTANGGVIREEDAPRAGEGGCRG